jgi:GABA(A) receptor-associated protein
MFNEDYEFFYTFTQIPIDERKRISDNILSRYPNNIPVVVDKVSKSSVSSIKKNKYIIPGNIILGKFLHEIRKYLSLKSEDGLVVFINGCIPSTSSYMNILYDRHKDEDGFLYIVYTGENTFG